MPRPKPERRSLGRTSARIPVSINSSKGEIKAVGYTRDLSMSGIFLYTDSQIRQGTELEMVLILPPELTHGETRWVCCQAAVVRVESGGSDGGFGVAASIQSIEILPEIVG